MCLHATCIISLRPQLGNMDRMEQAECKFTVLFFLNTDSTRREGAGASTLPREENTNDHGSWCPERRNIKSL